MKRQTSLNRLKKRNLTDVDFCIFGNSFDYIDGAVSFLDTPSYTFKGRVGFFKKTKGKYFACPYYCFFKKNNKWSKGLVIDILIKKGKVISYTLKTGLFQESTPVLNNREDVTISAKDINFEHGFVSFRDKEWMVGEVKINQIIMNRKLKKIKQ